MSFFENINIKECISEAISFHFDMQHKNHDLRIGLESLLLGYLLTTTKPFALLLATIALGPIRNARLWAGCCSSNAALASRQSEYCPARSRAQSSCTQCPPLRFSATNLTSNVADCAILIPPLSNDHQSRSPTRGQTKKCGPTGLTTRLF